jgi:hypothetical protein
MVSIEGWKLLREMYSPVVSDAAQLELLMQIVNQYGQQ